MLDRRRARNTLEEALAAAIGLNAMNEVPEVSAETKMPIMVSLWSVVDPGATRATVEVPNDNAGAHTQTLANITGPGHEIEVPTLSGAPDLTAGTKMYLYLPWFLPWRVWSASSYNYFLLLT